jgi:alanine racemase
MGRLGVSPAIACELARKIQGSAHLALEGVCTHMSSADERSGGFSKRQMLLFQGVLDEMRAVKIEPEYVHAANTAAVFNGVPGPDPRFDLVRCGIGLYGVDPARLRGGELLEPALSLRTQIIFLKDHPARAPIGYGRRFHTPVPTRIATMPIGYNDGYPYALGGRAWVLIHGQRAPVVGQISMDYTMVDVGKIRDVKVGDTVTLVGRDGDDRIRMTDVAEWAGTIPYEIPCRFGRRVARVYSPLEAVPEPEPFAEPELDEEPVTLTEA